MGKLIYDGVVYAGGVVVDSALSTTSTNPVQNKVVAEAVNTINTRLTEIASKLLIGGALFDSISVSGRVAGDVNYIEVVFTNNGNNVYLLQFTGGQITTHLSFCQD